MSTNIITYPRQINKRSGTIQGGPRLAAMLKTHSHKPSWITNQRIPMHKRLHKILRWVL